MSDKPDDMTTEEYQEWLQIGEDLKHLIKEYHEDLSEIVVDEE